MHTCESLIYSATTSQASQQADQVLGLMDASAEVVFSRKVPGESSSRIPADASAGTAMECAVQLTENSGNSEIVCTCRNNSHTRTRIDLHKGRTRF